MPTKRRSDEIVADFLSKIGSGELLEGQSVPPESALCASYGVSRSVVREALRAVSAKGFLTISQGAVTQIAPKSRWNVLETDFLRVTGGEEFFAQLQEARDVLEPGIAGLAAERIELKEIEDMRQIQDELIAKGDSSAEIHAELDIEFHRAIASAAKNPVLMSLHDSISSLGLRQRQAAVAVEGAVGRAIFWHEQILKAIEAGDPAGAEAAMGLHMRQVRDEIENLDSRDLKEEKLAE